MIDPIKKKLSLLFLSIIVSLNVVGLTAIYSILHFRLVDNAKAHIKHNIESEFLPHYIQNDRDTLEKVIEDEHIQVLDRQGQITIDVQSSIDYRPRVNAALLDAAFSGREEYEMLESDNERYLVLYSPLDQAHILKVTMSLDELYDFERDFGIIILLMSPVMLILCYVLSRYMVSQSLKPIIDVMTYQETFSSNVTHELNSPLTAIKGNIEVSLRKDRSPGEYRETLKLSLRSVNDIIELLNNLYLLATSKFKSLDLLKEKVFIKKIVDDLIEEHEPLIYTKNLDINASVSPEVQCTCDASLLKRAIGNLLENAVKYTPDNGVIEIGSRQENRNFTLTISNTCDPITKDELSNFYKPFYRGGTALAGKVEGAGLGLHIVRYIINSHGGTITARTEGNKLEFTITIPTD